MAISGYQWLLGQHYEFHQVLIFMNFGRTDLRKGVSGAKFDAESDFDVRLAVAPQKPDQNCEKLIFRFENFRFFFFFVFFAFFRPPSVVGG